jgi:hypothetical protein
MEATYHCKNKRFVGDRINLHKLFGYICFDALPASSKIKYHGLYSSKERQEMSSLEDDVKAWSTFTIQQTLIKPFVGSPVRHFSDVVAKSDVVHIDISNSADFFGLAAPDYFIMFKNAKAYIIIMEIHSCEIHNIFNNFLETVKWFEFYGYEIYHKEATFADNLVAADSGIADDDNPICHFQVSWIRMKK